jgi:2-oxo-4-hydroxy-4-carboxy-5-ureidoimidazoline decarboxylase
MTLQQFNSIPQPEVVAELMRCCGSTRWAGLMAARRPFPSMELLLTSAEELWNGLSPDDWKEAFSHHPRIGDVGKLREKFAATAEWASKEQSGVSLAAEDVLVSLAEKNRTYEKKFGYIFIVCATGKSARELLELLDARLMNDPPSELHMAAAEQLKITRLRLNKLFASS